MIVSPFTTEVKTSPNTGHSSKALAAVTTCVWLCRNAFFGPLGAFDQGLCRNTMRYNVVFSQNQLPTFGCYTIAWSLAV